MEFEVAAIHHFIKGVLKNTHNYYFDEVPQDMKFPCIFYPPPEANEENFSTSTFAFSFTEYVKIFGNANHEANSVANLLSSELARIRHKICEVDNEGNNTGKYLHITSVKVRKADECVWQLAITYKRYTEFHRPAVPIARRFYVDGKPV